jgi:hypothetical protein
VYILHVAVEWAVPLHEQEEEEEDEFDKVVLGDVVILMEVGIAMWKGDLTISANLR